MWLVTVKVGASTTRWESRVTASTPWAMTRVPPVFWAPAGMAAGSRTRTAAMSGDRDLSMAASLNAWVGRGLEFDAGLVPIVQELLEPDVGERVLHQLLEDGERHGGHMGRRQGRVHDVERIPDGRGEYLGLEAVVRVDLDDLADQIHPDV